MPTALPTYPSYFTLLQEQGYRWLTWFINIKMELLFWFEDHRLEYLSLSHQRRDTQAAGIFTRGVLRFIVSKVLTVIASMP
ncbi:hypothetical protein SUGI_1016830 [Cryptomeria japonica]|nr:hypothetical protein SUGI_1016830 [Cryptomeria japonica]